MKRELIQTNQALTAGRGACTSPLASVLVLVLSLASFSAVAAEYTVSKDGSGDFTVIQDAIDAASEGDTISVNPGSYYESIRFNGKNIVLRSSNPYDPEVVEATIINARRRRSVVEFQGTEVETCVLDGFTITGGEAEYGGGINGCNSWRKTTARISRCIIRDNDAYGQSSWQGGPGGGVFQCDGRISECTIIDNTSQKGGGLSECGGRISNCTIADNLATTSGGGLVNCDGYVYRCIIKNNVGGDPDAGPSGAGGGFMECGGTVDSCLITGNSASLIGGGVCYSSTKFINCTFENNSAIEGGGAHGCSGSFDRCVFRNNYADFEGGAIEESTARIDNCLFYGNHASRGGALQDCRGPIVGCTVARNTADIGGGLFECDEAIVNCIIWGNSAGEGPQMSSCSEPLHCCIEDWTGGGDIIPDDPLFFAAGEGNYHLTPSSPCIDAGYEWDNTSDMDLDRKSRQIGEGVDIGCYEHTEGRFLSMQAESDFYFGQDQPGLWLNAVNFGSERVLDLYLAVQFPGGEFRFAPNLGSSVVPAIAGLVLEEGYGCSISEALSLPFSLEERDGVYRAYAALLPSGSGDLGNPASNIASCFFNFRREANAQFVIRADGSGDFAAIQDGIDASRDGDTLILEPGTYFENIRVNGKNITIRSANPWDWEIVKATVIDGGQQGPVITLSGTEEPRCSVFGLTISNGLSDCGAGIMGGPAGGPYSWATVSRCWIAGNSALGPGPNRLFGGGGVYGLYGRIVDSTICGNSAANGGGLSRCNGDIERCEVWGNASDPYDGGGLIACEGQIIECIIESNVAAGSGGGMALCRASAVGCTIRDNVARFGGGGTCGCQGKMYHCVITRNSAAWGAGIYQHKVGGGSYPDTVIFDCLITGNSAIGESCGYGGGIAFCYAPIVNCTIAYNSATIAGGGVFCSDGDISNNIIYYNSAPDSAELMESTDPTFSCVSGVEDLINGNISADPMFVTGPLGDYYLDPASPCIDAGSQSAEEAGLSDRTTRAAGTPDTGTVDMGYHHPIPAQ